MFQVYRHPNGICEIRVDMTQRAPGDLSAHERRAFMRLASSLEVVNIWLATLAADRGYAEGTGYEYAKVCRYALEWLAHYPVQLVTGLPVGHSLLTLSVADIRALDAWLTIPMQEAEDQIRLCKTGQLPARYRTYGVAATTRQFRRSVLSAFYDWVLIDYAPADGITLTRNPFKRIGRYFSVSQEQQRPEGFLPRSSHTQRPLTPAFRSNPGRKTPDALTLQEIQLVFDAIPQVSQGYNAANRNGALIRLLLWGMLREAELVHLTWECVNEQVLQVRGKGGKLRQVPIADQSTWAFVHAYTNELRTPLRQRFHGPLLRHLDHDEQPITIDSVEHLMHRLKRYFQQQGERATDPDTQRHLIGLANRLHSHLFRATGATYLAAHGMDLLKLALLLGHSDPATTKQYYLAADQLDLSEEVQRIFEQVDHLLVKATKQPYTPPDPYRWYRRRGLLSSEGGEGTNDSSSTHS